MMVGVTSHRQENAMNDFVKKFAHVMIGALSCFDRVIFKGHLPIGAGGPPPAANNCSAPSSNCTTMVWQKQLETYPRAVRACYEVKL
jgi:hypothetical protein